MPSMNISLPEPMRAWVEEQVATGGYSTASEFFRQLVRDAQKRQESERVDALLVEGLQSGNPVEVTDEFWARTRRRIEERLKGRVER